MSVRNEVGARSTVLHMIRITAYATTRDSEKRRRPAIKRDGDERLGEEQDCRMTGHYVVDDPDVRKAARTSYAAHAHTSRAARAHMEWKTPVRSHILPWPRKERRHRTNGEQAKKRPLRRKRKCRWTAGGPLERKSLVRERTISSRDYL